MAVFWGAAVEDDLLRARVRASEGGGGCEGEEDEDEGLREVGEVHGCFDGSVWLCMKGASREVVVLFSRQSTELASWGTGCRRWRSIESLRR